MGTFTFYSGNRAFFDQGFTLFDFDDTESDTLAVMVFQTSMAPYDPFNTAWRIEFDLAGLQEHVIVEGPNAGDSVPIAGTVTGVRYYDFDGNLLLEGTGLNGNIPLMSALFDMDRGYQVWEALMQGDHVFNTSAQSNGPDLDDDTVQTGRGRDTVNGNTGDSYIVDRGGRDVYHGGDGFDQISYANYWFWEDPGGVLVGLRGDLEAGTIRGPDKQVDIVSGIESVRGTHLNDTLVGDAGNNHFMGLMGNDRFDGAGGFDEIRYHRDDRFFGMDGIVANLANGRIRDSFGTIDRVVNVEAVRGSQMRDRMWDDDGNNRLRGEGGNDYLSASGGFDTLQGGAGRDQFVFVGTSFGTDVISDFSKADRDRIQILEADSLADLTFQQDGSTAVIRLNATSVVRVLNFDIDDFAAGDFIF